MRYVRSSIYLVVTVVAKTVVIVGKAFDFEHVQFHGRQINSNDEKPNQHHQIQ